MASLGVPAGARYRARDRRGGAGDRPIFPACGDPAPADRHDQGAGDGGGARARARGRPQGDLVRDHHVVLEAIASASSAGRHPRRSTSPAKRNAGVRAFREDPKIHLFNGQIAAAGEVIDLTPCSLMYIMENDWTPKTLVQAIGRANRPGQVEPLTVWLLTLAGSIDDALSRTLARKQPTSSRWSRHPMRACSPSCSYSAPARLRSPATLRSWPYRSLQRCQDERLPVIVRLVPPTRAGLCEGDPSAPRRSRR